jgi:undecaprenyl-diphosphatase
MKQQKKISLYVGIGLLAAFVLWTVLVRMIDVKSIGPEGSSVGFAAFNACVHELTGVHFGLYLFIDWVSILPFLLIFGFGLTGLIQWIKRKSFLKVDYDILVLGGFYAVVLAFYAFFEVVVVNYRPVLIEGVLEASYPSSTTVLVLCVMLTALMQLWNRIGNKTAKIVIAIAILAFTAFMVIGRLVSGVHWVTDIIGGALLSASLVTLYTFFCGLKQADQK